jgi:hypothetical protein
MKHLSSLLFLLSFYGISQAQYAKVVPELNVRQPESANGD